MKIKKVLVSQPKPASDKSPYYDIAEKYGVEIVFRPFIKVESLSAKEFRQQKVSILDHTAIVFTSRHAIDHFFTLCTELRVTIPETMKYFCTSEQIALYIQKYVQYRKRKVHTATASLQTLSANLKSLNITELTVNSTRRSNILESSFSKRANSMRLTTRILLLSISVRARESKSQSVSIHNPDSRRHPPTTI